MTQEEMQMVKTCKRKSTSLEFGESKFKQPWYTIVHHQVGKNRKRFVNIHIPALGVEVDTPLLLEGVCIAPIFGDSLLAIFINKNTHLLTIKKQSFGDFILQK